MSKESAFALATGVQVPSTSGTAKSVESVPETGAAESTVTQTTSDPRLHAILKKEVKLTQDQIAFKKQQAEWQEKIRRADEIIGKGNLYDETFKKSKLDALKLLGYSDTDILNIMADVATPNERTPEEIARSAALEEIKKAEDKRREAETESQKQKNADIIKLFRDDIAKTIESDPKKYKFCKFHGKEAEDLAYAAVEEVLKLEGKLIDKAEALQMAEDHFREQKKLMDELDKEDTQQQQQGQPQASSQSQDTQNTSRSAADRSSTQPKPKTLTNQVAPTVQALMNRRESSEQKRERLMRALSEGVHPSTLR